MAFLYPWGNTQQLNLDWILQKIKELEAGSGGADLDEVATALISASYSVQAYDRSDIVFRDGKLYRANQAIPAPGEAWTPAHWDEILLGDTVSNLVRYVAALSNDQIVNSSSVTGTHTSDALDTLKNEIDGLSFDSDNISNESLVAGDNVSDALDTLDGAIGDEATARANADNLIRDNFAKVETGTTATQAYAVGEYVVYNGILHLVTAAITNGATFTASNTRQITAGDAFKAIYSNYYPDFYFGTTQTTVDANTFFNYIAISNRLLMIFGRVHIVSKNGAGNNTMFLFNLPDGYHHTQTSNPANLGIVFLSSTISNLVVRLDTGNSNTIFLAVGGSGSYSGGVINEDDYLTVLAFIPLSL